MFHILLPIWVLPLVTCNILQLDLVSLSNASSTASKESPARNTSRLTTYNDCFDHFEGHLFTTVKADCERALDELVAGKSLTGLHSFSYQKRGATDRLPVEVQYGSCSIALMMFDLDARISLTYAEIYAELLGPDGVLKECLGSNVPAVDALGGQTVLGPRNMLIADVTGRPNGAADQESR